MDSKKLRSYFIDLLEQKTDDTLYSDFWNYGFLWFIKKFVVRETEKVC